MKNYRQIKVDLEVYKGIAAKLRYANESENDVLRRLLQLPPAQKGRQTSDGWQGKGVNLPAGTKLLLTHNGVEYRGEIRDGAWCIGEEIFYSPSGAADGLAKTKKGEPVSLDGWREWRVKRPGDTGWIRLDELRHPHTAQHTAKRSPRAMLKAQAHRKGSTIVDDGVLEHNV